MQLFFEPFRWHTPARANIAIRFLASCILFVLFTPSTMVCAQDITPTFEIAHAPWDEYTATDIFTGTLSGDFQPLNPPTNINQAGQEAWLRTTLPAYSADAPIDILEIPGQIFNYIDVWFLHPDGNIDHHYAGDRYAYIERTVKHASTAFPVPRVTGGSIDVLIRARNETMHRMNFAAWIWSEDQWQSYLLNKRAWYGAFIGAMLILCMYNLFLAVTLRDSSYLLYVGYILCLCASIVLLSGLAEEYLWPEGKPASFVLAFTGAGTFLAVGFANKFLKVRSWRPAVFWISTLVSGLAMVCGVALVFSHSLPLVPGPHSVTVVHFLCLISGVYFIVLSLASYFSGVTQARFLALSMLAMLSCALVYFSYTYGFVQYNIFIGHSLEIGGLAEGVLLSLALADRITILSKEKQAAERGIIEAQKSFSLQLIAAQERERQTISESLHDSIGHAVLVLRNNLLKGIGLRTQQDQRDDEDKSLAEQVDLCSEIMSDVRRLSHDLHPHVLQRLGLEEAIKSTLDRSFDSTDIRCESVIAELPNELAPEIEITIYRVIQESLNNILKHAKATKARLSIEVDSGTIHCSLIDNGVGFSGEPNDDVTLGLREMKGRVELVGGKFAVQSSPGNGTAVVFEIPVSPK